ncbi:MAG TPA: carbon-nitrogen hydrolase family protein [Symbiobacteriaceae bacterium]|nr:carbon-nitrogen hydrolase family protein [Symbiobacteriaceae bacterium]
MGKRVRIAAVQFDHRPVTGFDQFAAQVLNFVRLAEDDKCQLMAFPEYLTAPLVALDPDWSRWTGPYQELFSSLARSTRMTILAGTHLTERENQLYNTAHLFLPSGEVFTQEKVHMTPGEGDMFMLERGQGLKVVDTPVGRVAVLVCFDVEFPDAARVVCEAGADILLVPSATGDRAGFWRVRHCCHARAVENQVYVVHSALVGGLPSVRLMEQHWGKSAIITPCDIGFPMQGLAAEGEWNQGLCVVGEVDLGLLDEVRRAGSVLPRAERRPEAYRILVPERSVVK